MANELPDNVVRIVIDNHVPVPAEVALNWTIAHVDFFAERFSIDPGKIIIRKLGIGTTTLELWFIGIGAVGGVMAAIGGVGSFAVAYAQYLREGHQQIAPSTVNIINSYAGSKVTVCQGTEEPIIVQRQEIFMRDDQAATLEPQITRVSSRGRTHRLPEAMDRFDFDDEGNDVLRRFDDGTFEIRGRIVTSDGGRFALFRSGHRQYQIIKPRDLLQTIPFGEDIIVLASLGGDNRDLLEIQDWRLESDDAIDWENEQGLPGVQVEKLGAIERRGAWLDREPALVDLAAPTLAGVRPEAILLGTTANPPGADRRRTIQGKIKIVEGKRVFFSGQGGIAAIGDEDLLPMARGFDGAEVYLEGTFDLRFKSPLKFLVHRIIRSAGS